MKKISVLVLSGLLMVSQPIMAGGIPVFDGAAVAQSIQQGIQLAEQIKNQIDQLKQLEKQVKSMSGMRDVGRVARSTLDTAVGIGSEWS